MCSDFTNSRDLISGQNKAMKTEIVVIGAGPAGMMAAIAAAECGKQVIIFEKNKSAGKKLLLTGNGRCNLTNAVNNSNLVAGFYKNGRFLYKAFAQFGSQELMDWFSGQDVPLMIDDNRVFPKSQHSADILKALLDRVKSLEIEVYYNSPVLELIVEGNLLSGVRTATRTVFCNSVIVATGGLSWTKTGSDGDGYRFARQVSHSIVKPKPGLVGLELTDNAQSGLTGLTLTGIAAGLYCDDLLVAVEKGDMIFTHYGISGPLILNLSRFVANEKCKQNYLVLDLFPDQSVESLQHQMILIIKENTKKQLKNVVSLMVPERLADFILTSCNVKQSTQVSQLKRSDLLNIIRFMKTWQLPISKSRPFEEAMVTVGGVSLTEINPSTMESKICSGLFFAGEVLNLDGRSGGFNLQAAFSTGRLAGIKA